MPGICVFSRKNLFVVALLICATVRTPAAITVVITGPTDVQDTTIYSDAPSDNAGGGDTNRAGRINGAGLRRLLIRFDVSAIPATATVNSATVSLEVVNVPTTPPSPDHSLHRLTASWVEGSQIGTGTGGFVESGAACWSSRQQGSVLWTTPGGDFDPAPSATTNVGTALGSVIWTGPGLQADVQAWVNGSQPNSSWILIGDESVLKSARGFASAEALSGQPELTVVYTNTVPVELSLFGNR